MVFSVAARHSGNSGTVAVDNLTTDSVAPTADSLLLIASCCQNDNNSVAPTFQSPSGGGLTYTQVTTIGSTPIQWDGSSQFRIHAALYLAIVGGSPSAHTITVDHDTNGFYNAVGCDVTGYDSVDPIIQSAANGADGEAGNSVIGTATFASALTTGSLVVVALGAGADSGGGFAAPTIGGQPMSPLFNQNDNWTQGALYFREIDGTESDGVITCTDMGDTVGNWTMLAVEIAATAGADQDLNIPFHQQINSIFPLTLINQISLELEIGFLSSAVQLFAPDLINQAPLELNVPRHESEIQIFVPTLSTGDKQLAIPFFENINSFFTPVAENQTAQNINLGFVSNTAQVFVPSLTNQTSLDLNVSFFQNTAFLFTPTVFNEGEELFEPTLVGNGSLADRIMAGLIDQGFLTGSIVDREYARLLAKLSLTAPQPKSLDDLYSLAGEENRILGIGIEVLTPA